MNIIQRFRLDFLKKRAGRLYHEGKPFTGIAYEVHGSRVVANVEVTDGVPGWPAELWDPATIRALLGEIITVDALDTNDEFPKEGDYFEGALFEGIAYAFDSDTGRLVEELNFRPKWPAPCREWFPSGAMEADYDRLRPDGMYESVTYYENGGIRTIHTDKVSWGVTPEGRLRSLILSLGYPKAELQRVPIRVDPMLYLAGKGITDKFIARLEDLPCLDHLTIDDTKITAKGLERFRVCTNLTYLGTYSKNGFSEADIRELLALIPGCRWDHRP